MPDLSFIDVGEPTAERRRRNANQARSAVMTGRRERQLSLRRVQEHPEDSHAPVIQKKGVPTLKQRLLRQIYKTKHLLEPCIGDLATSISTAALHEGIQSGALSNASLVEKGFVALQEYKKPVTKHMHMLINHGTIF